MKAQLLQQLDKLAKMFRSEGYEVDIKVKELRPTLLLIVKITKGDVEQIQGLLLGEHTVGGD